MNRQRFIARTALLLAILSVFQSLRLLLPLPPLLSSFLIGCLVNATLLLGLAAAGRPAALLLALLAPLTAYFQQMLPLPLLILPVAAGNMLYVLVYSWLRLQGSTLAAVTAAAAKALSVYWLVSWMLGWISLAPKLAAALLFAMSWPQFITAVAGAAIARSIASRLRL